MNATFNQNIESAKTIKNIKYDEYKTTFIISHVSILKVGNSQNKSKALSIFQNLITQISLISLDTFRHVLEIQ